MKYETGQLLGSGGMGEVYRALDTSLNRPVALKFLKRADPIWVERLLREARALAKIKHPNICQVYDTGEMNGTHFIAMQFVDGMPLDKLAPSLSLREKVQLMVEVGNAVQAAHDVGFIHRDLKPANILVERTASGTLHPYVTDFGLVHESDANTLTSPGEVLGTPEYMAPEQASGQGPFDARTDIYALGAILYWLLSGKPPHQGDSPMQVVLDVLQKEPVPLRQLDRSLPASLEVVALTCLAREPARRYDSARAMRDDLRRYLDGSAPLARLPGLGSRTVRLIGQHPRLGLASLMTVAVLFSLSGLWVRDRHVLAERAQKLSEANEQAEAFDSAMRAAALRPLHDIRPEQDKVLAQMHKLESTLTAQPHSSSDEAVQAAVHYALGRGYLALRNPKQAREHLEQAWKAGDHAPEVRSALGLALGELYSKARDELARTSSSSEERNRQQKQIEVELRDQALQYLQGAPPLGGRPAAYIEALAAYVEGRTDEALAASKRALDEDPGLYEAHMIAGDVGMDTEQIHQRQGETAKALADDDMVEQEFTSALEVGRSDNRLLGKECAHLTFRAIVLEWGEHADQATTYYDKAEAFCRQAISVDPNDAIPTSFLVQVMVDRIEFDLYHGKDIRPAVQEAIALAEQARAHQPLDDELCHMESSAYLFLSQYQKSHGQDTKEAVQKAIALDEIGVKANPNNDQTMGQLAIAYKRLGETLDDPDQADVWFDKAAKTYQRAIALEPISSQYDYNLGVLYLSRAERATAKGSDPTSFLDLAEASFNATAKKKPDMESAYMALSAVDVARAHLAMAADRTTDAQSLLDHALAMTVKAIDASPTYSGCYQQRGEVLLERAEFAEREGRDADAESELKQADEAIHQANKIDPNDANTALDLGRLSLLRARLLATQKHPADEQLRKAQEQLDAALKLDPKMVDAQIATAQVVQLQSQIESRAGHAAQAQTLIDRAVTELDEVLANEPTRWRALALKASLQIVRADGAKKSEQASLRDEARKELEQALQHEPVLRAEFGALQKRLAQEASKSAPSPSP